MQVKCQDLRLTTPGRAAIWPGPFSGYRSIFRDESEIIASWLPGGTHAMRTIESIPMVTPVVRHEHDQPASSYLQQKAAKPTVCAIALAQQRR